MAMLMDTKKSWIYRLESVTTDSWKGLVAKSKQYNSLLRLFCTQSFVTLLCCLMFLSTASNKSWDSHRFLQKSRSSKATKWNLPSCQAALTYYWGEFSDWSRRKRGYDHSHNYHNPNILFPWIQVTSIVSVDERKKTIVTFPGLKSLPFYSFRWR